jgi:hypothetical protein
LGETQRKEAYWQDCDVVAANERCRSGASPGGTAHHRSYLRVQPSPEFAQQNGFAAPERGLISALESYRRDCCVETERRKHPRHPTMSRPSIYLGKDTPLIPCELVNMSEGGARLVHRSPPVLPAHFMLFFSLDGSRRRSCRVIWRNGDDIGVAFED